MSITEGLAPIDWKGTDAPPTPTGDPPPPAETTGAPPVPPAETTDAAKPPESEKPPEGKDQTKLFADAELKVPEGIVFEGDQRKEFAELASRHGLPHEAAQELLEYGAKALKAAAEKSSNDFKAVNEGWQKEVREDKVIGGDKFDREVVPAIAKLFDEYTTDRPGLIKALDDTGAGNNPHVIRLLYAISKALNEGRPVQGEPAGQKRPVDIAHALYPNNP